MKTAAPLWLLLFGIYLFCAPATFYFEDSPELAACALSLGNTHPPGYPLLILLGRLVQSLPVGGVCFRFNLLSAASAAGAATILGLLVFRLSSTVWPESKTAAGAASVMAGGCWALSDTFWWEAVIGDKYPPYYMLFMLVMLLGVVALKQSRRPAGTQIVLLGLAAGVCFGFHYYAIFALPMIALVIVYPAFSREMRSRVAWLRILFLASALGILPLSTRILFPPIRAAANVELNWGRPDSASRLNDYLRGRIYREAFEASSIPVSSDGAAARFIQSLRFLHEEIPTILLLGIPAGVLILVICRVQLAAALAACALGNWIYAMNFTEKVVRWYEPAYGILMAFSAIGILYCLQRVGRKGAAIMVVLAILGCTWQFRRGYERCSLGRFYAAHDFARNLLVSIPFGAVYLGAGDFDLFPLWAVRHCENLRTDIDGIGVASFLDPGLAGAGNQANLAARLDWPADSQAALGRLLAGKDGVPVMVAPVGYDARIYDRVRGLEIQQTRGLAGRLQSYWDAPGSFKWSRRLHRAYTYRGLNYARAGALADLVRPRDEVARGAMLQYPLCFSVLARQGFRFGMQDDGAWAIEIARDQMEALVGPLGEQEFVGAGPAATGPSGKFHIAEGFYRLADLFDGRGVRKLAGQYRDCALAITE